MKILVRNNDVGPAYKILMRRLEDENFTRDIRKKEFHRSKSQKRREKHKHALIHLRKQKQKQETIFFKYEERITYQSRKPKQKK